MTDPIDKSRKAIAYLHTSGAANVGADKDSDNGNGPQSGGREARGLRDR
jgi:hypothetical protein